MLKGDHTDNLQPVYRRETAILNRKINWIPVYSDQILPNLNLYMYCILLFIFVRCNTYSISNSKSCMSIICTKYANELSHS
ncbi:hypothetical protein JHK84_027867 [Glycine max]|nr:hypothetical protein JHK84_027867 [Glycine max]